MTTSQIAPNGAHAPSASTILPDAVSDKLAALAEAASSIDWALGDATIELVAELYPRFPKAEIRAAVATRAQLQPSAVRAREATARYWDEADRAEYEGLSYSHFRLAARQTDPRADLTFCIESADDWGGQPMPYHAYAAWVRDRKGGPEEPTPAELLERAIAALTKYRDVAEGRGHARANEALGVLESLT